MRRVISLMGGLGLSILTGVRMNGSGAGPVRRGNSELRLQSTNSKRRVAIKRASKKVASKEIASKKVASKK